MITITGIRLYYHDKHRWRNKNKAFRDQRDGPGDKSLALHAVDSGSNPGTTYDPKHHQEWTLSTNKYGSQTNKKINKALWGPGESRKGMYLGLMQCWDPELGSSSQYCWLLSTTRRDTLSTKTGVVPKLCWVWFQNKDRICLSSWRSDIQIRQCWKILVQCPTTHYWPNWPSFPD